MRIVHDTAALPPAEQFEYYREIICSGVLQLRAERDEDGPCRARLTFESFGGVILSHVALPRHRLTRDGKGMARSAPAMVYVHLVRRGGIEHDHRGEEDWAGAGQIMTSDSARPLHALIPERFDTISLGIPRAEVAIRAPGFEDHVGEAHGLARGSPALLASFVRAIARNGDDMDPAARLAAGGHLCDMVASMFADPSEEREPSVAGARRHALLAHISRHVLDSGLTAEATARHFGLSRRYIDKLFEDADETFHEVVVRKRLEAAAAMLQAPGGMRRTITDIAYACGFADLTTFNRRFKSAFGQTPRDHRAEARRAAAEAGRARLPVDDDRRG